MIVQLHIALFIVLIILAVWGSLHLLWCIVVYVISPLCDMVSNYKKYKKYYDEHFEDRFQEIEDSFQEFLNKKEKIEALANIEETKEAIKKVLNDNEDEE